MSAYYWVVHYIRILDAYVSAVLADCSYIQAANLHNSKICMYSKTTFIFLYVPLMLFRMYVTSYSCLFVRIFVLDAATLATYTQRFECIFLRLSCTFVLRNWTLDWRELVRRKAATFSAHALKDDAWTENVPWNNSIANIMYWRAVDRSCAVRHSSDWGGDIPICR